MAETRAASGEGSTPWRMQLGSGNLRAYDGVDIDTISKGAMGGMAKSYQVKPLLAAIERLGFSAEEE